MTELPVYHFMVDDTATLSGVVKVASSLGIPQLKAMYLHWTNFTLKKVLFLLVTCHVYSDSSSTGDLYIRDDVSSWTDSRSTCSGDLYIPDDDSVPGSVSTKMLLNTYYWIGAIQYSTWRWTEDNSPLYKYIGLRTLPLGRQPSFSSAWNSVHGCHFHCGEDCTVLGLRMNDCYCLCTDEDVSLPDESTEVTCPGNWDEKCGNNSGLSVYKLEGIKFRPTEEGQCVFAERSGGVASFSQVNQTLCDRRRRYACSTNSTSWRYGRCSGYICVTQRQFQKDWAEASDACSLVKVTRSNKDNFTQAMHTGIRVTYWIGLSRQRSSKWINGTMFARYGTAFLDNAGPKCLAMIADRGLNIDRLWVPCEMRHRSICETASTSSILPTTLSSSTTTEIETTSVLSSTEMTEMVTSEDGYVNVTDAADGTENNTLAPPGNHGLYIGLAVGCIILLVTVVVTLFVFRHKKWCFAQRGKFEPLDSAAVENETYGFHLASDRTTPAVASQQHRPTASPPTSAAPHHHLTTSPPPCGAGRTNIPIYDNPAITNRPLNAKDEYRLPTNDHYSHVTSSTGSYHHLTTSPPPPCSGRTINPVYDNAAITNTPLNTKDGTRIPYNSERKEPSAHAYDYLASDQQYQTPRNGGLSVTSADVSGINDTGATRADDYNHISYDADRLRYNGDYNTVVTRNVPDTDVAETGDVYMQPIAEADVKG